MPTTTKTKRPRKKRQYTQVPVTTDPGIKCYHCGHLYDHKKRKKYPNGTQRYLCGSCGKPFVVRRQKQI